MQGTIKLFNSSVTYSCTNKRKICVPNHNMYTREQSYGFNHNYFFHYETSLLNQLKLSDLKNQWVKAIDIQKG